MINFEYKISNTVLSKTNKKIAEYLLDNRDSVGFYSVKQIAEAIGVSDTSIIRFLRSLGYAGFADFKKEMGESMVQKYKETMSPGEKYLQTRTLLNNENIIDEVVNKTIDNIRTTFSTLSLEQLKAVADMLINSKRKYIVGFRGTSSCAEYMYRKLVVFLPSITRLKDGDSYVLEQLVDISKCDCLMLFSFSRYSKINFAVIKMAKEAGAKIILVTDKLTSPLAHYADIVITTEVSGPGVTNSYLAPMCLVEVILLLISKKLKPADKARLNRLDDYINNEGLY